MRACELAMLLIALTALILISWTTSHASGGATRSRTLRTKALVEQAAERRSKSSTTDPYDAETLLKKQGRPSLAATWLLPDEETKRGVGLLYFAYGGVAQIDAFLVEATASATSVRIFNPRLDIGVVTNNETVDKSVFTHHIVPRSDLLFPGSDCPDSCRPDRLPRQWTTRLYYMALSPFEITFALDSNTYQCPGPFAMGAMHRFLLAAEKTQLWGYDIAHANQSPSPFEMYPHCFAMVWRWNHRTSNVFRDWFMLMLRRGISTNDQDPLRIAEVRQHVAGGLRVGQLPTEFAASLYSASLSMEKGKFWPRVSRAISGPAQIVHGTPLKVGQPFGRQKGHHGEPQWLTKKGNTGPDWCETFNTFRGSPRRLYQVKFRSPILSLLNETACRDLLGEDKWSHQCPFAGGAMKDPAGDGELLPAVLKPFERLTVPY